MSLFDLFKNRHEPVRTFVSDADKFSTAQICELMNNLTHESQISLPAKSDEYVKSLINKLNNERDITIVKHHSSNGVSVFDISINRNGEDHISIAYQASNPNVVYITTAPYPFAGDRNSFLAYCNRFQHQFPMITIGCIEYENQINLPDNQGGYTIEPIYALRTCLPLLGTAQDFDNLVKTAKALPIYGYDLRDGYQSNHSQPYASRGSQINIQLEKLVNIHHFKAQKEGLFPADIALYGDAPYSKLSTKAPAVLSNPYLQYLDFTRDTWKMIPKSDSNETQHFRGKENPDTHQIERVSQSQLVCYLDYPTLYTIELDDFVKIETDEEFKNLMDLMSRFNYPKASSENPHDYALFKMSIFPYDDGDNSYVIQRTMTQSIPNEIDAHVIAMQIVDFFDRCEYPISTFTNQENNKD